LTVQEQRQTSMPDNHDQKSILIVEDDETLQQALAYNLA
jgi:hypothetical protein